MNNQISTTVSLEAVKAGENLVRIDVNLENVPDDLFGAAFHLKAGGVKWSLMSFEKGDSFPAGGLAPLMLAEEKSGIGANGEIIFGASLKRTDESGISDGTLVSFYLRTEGEGGMTFEFVDGHLSVLREVRKDIENVKWETGAFNTGELVFQQSLLQANTLQRMEKETFYSVELTAVYTVMAACLLIIIVGAGVYLFLKRRGRVRA